MIGKTRSPVMNSSSVGQKSDLNSPSSLRSSKHVQSSRSLSTIQPNRITDPRIIQKITAVFEKPLGQRKNTIQLDHNMADSQADTLQLGHVIGGGDNNSRYATSTNTNTTKHKVDKERERYASTLRQAKRKKSVIWPPVGGEDQQQFASIHSMR
jgi:hypothetical protein